MPQRHESEDGGQVEARPQLRPGDFFSRSRAAAKRHVDIPHDPPIEASMPATPEGDHGEVVRHAADHVLRRVDLVHQRPEPEEAPGQEQLQPDDVQVEVAEHAELVRGVDLPGGLRLADGNRVDEMEEEFHAQQTQEEAHAVEKGAIGGNAGGDVTQLMREVVEGDDGSREVEGGVEDVGEVVSEGVVFRLGRYLDAVLI